jgi:hypothetical protein
MVHIMVLNNYRIPTMIWNFGGTKAASHFFSHFSDCVRALERGDISGPLGPFDKSLSSIQSVGTHISNLDWRRPKTWDTPEKQVTSVLESVFMSGLSVSIFFEKIVKKNCKMRRIGFPGKISFFKKLISDDNHARYVQDLHSSDGRSKFLRHAEFYHLQQYNHAKDSIIAETGLSRDEAASELGLCGHEGAINSITAATGLSRDEATSELGRHGHKGSINNITAATGLLRDEAASELGRRGHEGAINSITVATGLSRDEAASKLGRCGC